MARKRLSRRELVEKDDITSSLERGTTWVVEHGRVLAIGVGIAVLIAAVAVGLRISAANRTAAAQNALAEVIQLYSTVTEGTPDEERFLAALLAAERVQNDYPGLSASQIARYFEALSSKQLGDSERAIPILIELSESGGGTVSEVARFALAELYKEEGDLELAVQSYQALANSGGFANEAVLFELGRLHEALSMPDEARDYYQTLVGDYPNSAFRSDADRALRRLAQPSTGEDS